MSLYPLLKTLQWPPPNPRTPHPHRALPLCSTRIFFIAPGALAICFLFTVLNYDNLDFFLTEVNFSFSEMNFKHTI